MDTTTLNYGHDQVIFDFDTYKELIPLTGWTVKISTTGYKSVRATRQPFVGKRLARLILNCQDTEIVDHINGNSLDNRKCNLRIVTPSQNQFNKKVSSTKASGLPKGVYYNKKLQNYYAQIRVEGRRIHLGSYSSIAAAEQAYIKASTTYHKEHAVHTSRRLE